MDTDIPDIEPVKRNSRPVPSFTEMDAMADFHARLSELETRQVGMSRRITQLEVSNVGGRRGEDELFDNRTMGMLLLLMVLPVILPMIGEMVSQWHLSS